MQAILFHDQRVSGFSEKTLESVRSQLNVKFNQVPDVGVAESKLRQGFKAGTQSVPSLEVACLVGPCTWWKALIAPSWS